MRAVVFLFLVPIILSSPVKEEVGSVEDHELMKDMVKHLFSEREEREISVDEDGKEDVTAVEEDKAVDGMAKEEDPAEIARFNNYMDAIYRRMNAALRAKLMDPMILNLSDKKDKSKSKNKKSDKDKKVKKEKRKGRMEEEDEEEEEDHSLSRRSAEEEDEDDEDVMNVEDDEEMEEEEGEGRKMSKKEKKDKKEKKKGKGKGKGKLTDEEKAAKKKEREEKKAAKKGGKSNKGKGKKGNGKKEKKGGKKGNKDKKEKDEESLARSRRMSKSKDDKKKGKKGGKSGKENEESKSMGSLAGIATLRRAGDVSVLNSEAFKIVKSEFSIGPLHLEVSKTAGHGKSRSVKTAKAITEQLKGKMVLKVKPDGSAHVKSVFFQKPEKVDIRGSLGNQKRRSDVYLRNSVGKMRPKAAQRILKMARYVLKSPSTVERS